MSERAFKKMREKVFSDVDVYEAALERIRYLYTEFDHIFVSFSGGKDSTAVLNCALVVAKELNRLPLEVHFYDEESNMNETIDYIKRLNENPDIDLKWWCLPFKQRNACSNNKPYWKAWDPKEKDLWIHPMPEFAISQDDSFKDGMGYIEFADNYWYKRRLRTCTLTGLRAEESMRRMKAVTTKKNDNYIARTPYMSKAHPIYDWKTKDVWLAVRKLKWDYNRAYDLMNLTDKHGKYLLQRIGMPFGEEPLRGLSVIKEMDSDLCDRYCNRLPVVQTAAMYANTELYGFGDIKKPKGMTYQEFLKILIDSQPDQTKHKVAKHVNGVIKNHYSKTDSIIMDSKAHALTGISYKFLCKLAIKGDFKNRTAAKAMYQALPDMNKFNLNVEGLKEFYKK